MQQLNSTLDQSVNFIEQAERGMIEARFVRRQPNYLIAYLSSQTGCNKACRFCHLTQSGQTEFINVTIEEYLRQARQVLRHYEKVKGDEHAQSVHYNFMSRGEVFANPNVHQHGRQLIEGLHQLSEQHQLQARLKFSTIMPQEMADKSLVQIFAQHQPDVYYSLYSTDPQWRKRWMPKALPVQQALNKLVDYQQLTRKIPVLHWAFIAGENDDQQTIEGIIEAVNKSGLRADFNIVRYNPFSDKQGHEPDEQIIQRNAEWLADGVAGSRVKIVTRVGFDVKASCGMFIAAPDRNGRIRYSTDDPQAQRSVEGPMLDH